LDLQIDRSQPVALYQQIVEQIKDRVADGRFPAGARLPTVRQLASDLGVTRLTVQSAYSDLQAAGWVESTVGRGTFVSQSVQGHSFGRGMTAPLTADAVINDILQINQIVGLRSMASASPDPRLFPADEFWSALHAQQATLLSSITYGSSQGDPQLRVEISRDLTERAIDVTPAEVLVTNGVTQGLTLIAEAVAQPGDCVLVEQPTYLGLLHTLKVHGVQPIGVVMDREGPVLAELEHAIVQHRPRFLYTVPTFQNPTGRCMSLARRSDLLDLAAAHGLLIVEDDIYGRLAYDGPAPLPLAANPGRAEVAYVTSYSKTLMPGLRLGCVVPPPRWADRLLSLRRAADLCSPPLMQRTLAEFLKHGGLKRHLRRVLPIYRERRNALVTALQRWLPESVRWDAPEGGFCCWLTLPPHPTFADLEQAALRHGWSIAPGEVFLAEPAAQRSVRVCFGALAPDAIRTGIEVLGHLIRDRLVAVEGAPVLTADWTPLV
jgi:DNA-binding transcriptional MocR family regulator